MKKDLNLNRNDTHSHTHSYSHLHAPTPPLINPCPSFVVMPSVRNVSAKSSTVADSPKQPTTPSKRKLTGHVSSPNKKKVTVEQVFVVCGPSKTEVKTNTGEIFKKHSIGVLMDKSTSVVQLWSWGDVFSSLTSFSSYEVTNLPSSSKSDRYWSKSIQIKKGDSTSFVKMSGSSAYKPVISFLFLTIIGFDWRSSFDFLIRFCLYRR